MTLEERFWAKVEKTNGCWFWRPAKEGEYGKFARAKRHIALAHRTSWELTTGPIPAGLFVCHHCDEPRCVNPEHLFLGTAADNSHDMVAKGRFNNPRKTRCKHGHAFDQENTYIDKKGRQNCRTCCRDKMRRRRAVTVQAVQTTVLRLEEAK